ncbi:hypothetical protein E2C01_034239 [Portunus trituberculatus]|uniref:Uncharacterized protein n=1 Tax=Portunus trituberculatus TaxID=210409 RepID=A0A5B7F524_PORTR|nr:hypothetical protein [Portunus trituberculatus]
MKSKRRQTEGRREKHDKDEDKATILTIIFYCQPNCILPPSLSSLSDPASLPSHLASISSTLNTLPWLAIQLMFQ